MSITAGGEGDLDVTVDRLVYLGTALQMLSELDDGTGLTVLLQNSARVDIPSPGARVGLIVEREAARLLAD